MYKRVQVAQKEVLVGRDYIRAKFKLKKSLAKRKNLLVSQFWVKGRIEIPV